MLSEADIKRLCELGWGERDLTLGERAGFKCEYCDRDLLASVDAYKLWQIDHIVPTHAGGTNDLDNFAVCCLICNCKLKLRWDPRTEAASSSRGDLLIATRDYVERVAKNNALRLEEIVAIISGSRGTPAVLAHN
jgi:hypothetical protein